VRALAVLALVACGARTPASPDELRVHLPSPPAHLNPLLASDAITTQVVLGDVIEPLFTLDGQGGIRPLLAERVEVSTDGTTWTFHLRRGVRWHDGRPFGADDARFAFELIQAGAPSILAGDLDDLRGLATPDEATLVVSFAAFRLGRKESLALLPVLPRHVFAGTPPAELLGAPASRAPVGTGPYAFHGWEAGGDLVFARASTWRGPPPAFARVRYRVIADRAQAVAELRRGRLDLLPSLAPGRLTDELAGDARVRLVAYEVPYFLAVRWRCDGRLADPRVRRALTMLLDREAVVARLLAGRGRVASAPWEPDDVAYDPGVAPWPFDPGAASALLAEAGATDLRVRLLLPAGSATLERVATLWQADARRAGVTLELVPDPAPLERVRHGGGDGVGYGWSTGPEMDFWHHFHSAGPENFGRCATPELDAALVAARTTADPAARRAHEHRVHRLLHELEPLTVISLDVRTAAAAARLANVEFGPLGVPVRAITFSRN
jgi:peptide/nickel transport system substrate-binding protein